MPVTHRRYSITALALGLSLASGVAAPPRGIRAATVNVDAFVSQAIHNTNTVRTLIHHDHQVIKIGSLTVTASVSGQEDEVHNREQDAETVTVQGKDKAGKPKTLHYTADVIFLNGHTYYRISLLKNTWTTRKGMTFRDPYTGGFKRARTTVTSPGTAKYTLAGTSGGVTHIRFSHRTATTSTTTDLWIAGGTTPYVVRELVHRVYTSAGKTTSTTLDSHLGPFNTQLIVQSPSSNGAL